MPREISYTNKSGGVYKKTIPRRCMCVSRYCAWWTHHSINRGSNRITIYNKDANIWEWERVILTELIYNYGKPQNRGNYSGRNTKCLSLEKRWSIYTITQQLHDFSSIDHIPFYSLLKTCKEEENIAHIMWRLSGGYSLKYT